MEEKIKIDINSRYNEFVKGDTGIVSGYVRGGDDSPCAVVILDKNDRYVLVQPSCLKRVSPENKESA